MAKLSSQKSYSKFTFDDLKALGLQVVLKELFAGVAIPDQAPGEWLNKTLEMNQDISLNTEKAKSEFIISPILTEVRRNNRDKIALYSGFNFTVDKHRGLQGFCDFLLTRLPVTLLPENPVIAVVEAKLSQDLTEAVPQCGAELYAAQLWNEQRNGSAPDVLYGIITTGESWLFIRLTGSVIEVNTHQYSLSNLPELLGVWQYVVDLTGG